MRRFLAITAIAAFLVSGLSACTDNTDDHETGSGTASFTGISEQESNEGITFESSYTVPGDDWTLVG